MKTTILLSGNEAIARGAYEAGVRVAAAYPGTPSTEILENIIQYETVYAEWAPNEKVALEVAVGASFGGARALCTMKHVGVNVASDPLLTAAYTGVNRGLVLISADDPGMHSSQNEQDNRHYARFAKIPMLEPADSQECKDLTLRAFEISEQFDTPILLRTTTRVNHGKSTVRLSEPKEPVFGRFERDPQKYVMIPAYAMKRHVVVEERLERLRELSNTTDLNRIEMGDTAVGVITSGIAYQYVKEAVPQASVLKLGMTYPLPDRLIREFASKVEKLYVVEELDPFIEEQVRAMGIEVIGKERFPIIGELNPRLVAAGFGVELADTPAPAEVPGRPPVLCPGCPHRGFYQVLKKMRAVVTGDIGCYTLGVLPPLEVMDTCVCMGASIGNALGVKRAQSPDDQRPVVAVIGDSTFVHSGITGLIDAVYNGTAATICILDNSITAMTGGQEHPGTGRTLMGHIAPKLDLPALARAIGVEDVLEVDPYDLQAIEKALTYAVRTNKPSVVITNRPCVLKGKAEKPPKPSVAPDKCTGCGMCFRIGCPAIESVKTDDGKLRARINADLCQSCAVCMQVCRFEAIGREQE